MRIRWTVLLGLTGLIMVTVGLVGCGQDASPEQRINELIREGELAAEDRDLAFFRETISQEFSNEQGLTRDQMLQTLSGYFFRNRKIYLITRIEDTFFDEGGAARTTVIVGMARSPVEGFDQLLALRADLYRLQLEFDMDEEIQLRHAHWERIKPEALFDGP